MPEEDMLFTHDKNAMLYLTGQNNEQATRNKSNSNTPGLHTSGTHGQESLGQFMASSPTQEGMVQLGSLVLNPPRHGSERLAEDQLLRRPVKLTPLELPVEVREAQRKKLLLIQLNSKPAGCKLDTTLKENTRCEPKPIVKRKQLKAVVCPSVATMSEKLKTQAQEKSKRPQLTRSNRIGKNEGKQLLDVTRGTIPASVSGKPAPDFPSARIKAQATCDGEASRKNPSAVPPAVERRRLRLRREQCLEEDQCQSDTSPRGLCADGGKLAQGVRGKGQQAECRGQAHAGKHIQDPCTHATTCKDGSIKKAQQDGGRKQSAKHILNSWTKVDKGKQVVLAGM